MVQGRRILRSKESKVLTEQMDQVARKNLAHPGRKSHRAVMARTVYTSSTISLERNTVRVVQGRTVSMHKEVYA